jgi:hypothetical protein
MEPMNFVVEQSEIHAGHGSRPVTNAAGRLRRGEIFGALLLLAACLIALAYNRLPPGICFHDSGDLQTAAATLGIAHPPGYVAYASLGYLLTLIPGLEPARAVTLGCLAAGVGALLLVAGVQIRLGVHPWLAAALSLALALHPRVWINLIVPEVYAPTWFFVIGATYLLTVYLLSDAPSRRHLVAAFFLLGFAVANRPPVLLMLPGFALATLLSWKRAGIALRKIPALTVMSAAGFLLPSLYAFGYLWIRDTAAQPYNYIEQYTHGTDLLPAVLGGPAAKAQRIWWLVSGAQYAAERQGGGVLLDRLSWVAEQIGAEQDLIFIAVIVTFAVGTIMVRRRNLSVLILLLGILVGAACFLCMYRAYDTAADLLPVLGVLWVFAGAALSPLLPRQAGRWRAGLAFAIFAVTALAAARLTSRFPNHAADYDATDYVRSLDWSVASPGALILTDWQQNAPLNYSCLVENRRSDVAVLHTPFEFWTAYAAREAAAGRSVFCADPPPVTPGTSVVPAGCFWRWEFHDSIPEAE